jgi:hypothetical protein
MYWSVEFVAMKDRGHPTLHEMAYQRLTDFWNPVDILVFGA